MVRLMPRHTVVVAILLVFLIAGSPLVHGGVWGDTWGNFIWGPRSLDIPEGLSLYAPTSELADTVASCFDLLAFLGGTVAVESVAAVVTATQQASECFYRDAVPTGDDFPIVLGTAYFLQLTQPRVLASGPPHACPETTLDVGVNLVGVGQPPANLSCFDVIAAFSADVVSTVERLNKTSNRFDACTKTAAATVAGIDFQISAGEGYIVHAASTSAPVNLNDLAHPVCGRE